MAQKSLPILNKVNTSMIWYSTYYFKHYKWLSSQNLYLLYFFNKLFVYLDLFHLSLLWVKPYSIYFYQDEKRPLFTNFERIRFFKPVTSYLVNANNKCIFFNLYYKTTLETFQALNKVSGSISHGHFESLSEQHKLTKIFFF